MDPELDDQDKPPLMQNSRVDDDSIKKIGSLKNESLKIKSINEKFAAQNDELLGDSKSSIPKSFGLLKKDISIFVKL